MVKQLRLKCVLNVYQTLPYLLDRVKVAAYLLQTLKAQGGVRAALESDFDSQWQVVGYTVAANVGVYREVVNEGARWTDAATALIKQAGPGSQVFFDKVRVKGPDGTVRELPGIFFNLK